MHSDLEYGRVAGYSCVSRAAIESRRPYRDTSIGVLVQENGYHPHVASLVGVGIFGVVCFFRVDAQRSPYLIDSFDR